MTTPDGTDDEPTRMVPISESAPYRRAMAEQERIDRAAARALRVRERLHQLVEPHVLGLIEGTSLGRVVDTIVMLLCEEIESP